MFPFFKKNIPITSKRDILIILANGDQKLSLIYQLIQPILKQLEIKENFNYKIINLYSYNLPIYKINEKLPKSFLSLTKTLNEYSNYIFIFPVWYSNVPGVLKNFIDWSGYWGTIKNKQGKIVGILQNKKAAIIASCWDTRKNYLKKLSNSIEYQIVDSVFSFFKIKHIKTLIVPDAHNHQTENLSKISNNIQRLITMFNKKI